MNLRHFFWVTVFLWQAVVNGQSSAPQEFKLPRAAFTQESDSTLINDVPAILYRDRRSVQVWIDGDPVIAVDTILRMYRILNTPQLIIKNHNDNKYYLYGGKAWYVSDFAAQGYVYKKVLPPVIHLMDSLVRKGKPASIKQKAKPFIAPQIVVTTEPSVLIYTDGKPLWMPIEGTGLRFVKNTPNDLIQDTLTKKIYLLLSGRWFCSQVELDGPWSFIPSDQLPAGFLRIPSSSPKSGVLIHVSGTEAAHRAVADAKQFRNRRIPRGIDASVVVRFDGGAEFASVFGSELFIAQNSDLPVFSYRNIYYALYNGAWYCSYSFEGPWSVSTQAPPDLDKLPSGSAFYYARYVHIADTTADYVETGFTGGYRHTYIQNNTIVYGTGSIYKSWCRRRFFLRPVTWLQDVSYEEGKGWVNQPAINYYDCTLP